MIRGLLGSTACVAALSACTTGLKVRVNEPYTPPPAREIALRTELAAGDTLEVEYSRNYPAIDTYPLGVGDELEIEVHNHPEFALKTTVAPDGTIAFHQIGTLKAAGRTIEELRATLAESLAPILPAPLVSVFLRQSDMRVARFLELLLSHPNGAVRELRVSEEGTVSLPGVGRVPVAGLTIDQTQELINERLHDSLPTLSVYVAFKKQAGDVFTVWGEVIKPGRFPMDGDVTLVEALAIAGGPTLYGDLERVVVMNAPVGGEPAIARTYDIADALAHGQSLSTISIRPRDTVLVVRVGIGDVNVWIDQYIRKNLPFNVGFNYRLNP